MYSADRKRVETALENCNLPSGRVGIVSSILDHSIRSFVVLFSSRLHNLCSISAAIVVSK